MPTKLNIICCTLLLIITNQSIASRIVHQAIYPTCKITPENRVVLEVLLETNTSSAHLYEPSEVSIVDHDIYIDIYLDSGNALAVDELWTTIDLGKFTPGIYNYTLIINRPNIPSAHTSEDQFTVTNIDCINPSNISERIYWRDRGSIKRTDQSGRKIEAITVAEKFKPFAFDIDVTGGKLYWGNRNTNILYRANLDGSDHEEMLLLDDIKPVFACLDHASEKIYGLPISNRGSIFKIDFDGSNLEFLTDSPVYGNSIKPDFANGKLYWISRSIDGIYQIQRMGIDGLHLETIVVGLPYLYMFTLDAVNKKMYWYGVFNDRARKVQCANLDGTEVRDVIDLTPDYLREFVIDHVNNKLLWSAKDSNYIHRANLDGSEPDEIIKIDLGSPNIMTIDTNTKKIYWYEGGPPQPGFATVKRANLDGTEIETVFKTVGYPWMTKIVPNMDVSFPKKKRRSLRTNE